MGCCVGGLWLGCAIRLWSCCGCGWAVAGRRLRAFSTPVLSLQARWLASAPPRSVRFNDGSIRCFGKGSYGILGSGNGASVGDNSGEMGSSLAAVALGDDSGGAAYTAVCAARGLLSVICALRFARCDLCSVLCALCSALCALCSALCACRVLAALARGA